MSKNVKKDGWYLEMDVVISGWNSIGEECGDTEHLSFFLNARDRRSATRKARDIMENIRDFNYLKKHVEFPIQSDDGVDFEWVTLIYRMSMGGIQSLDRGDP